MGAVVTREVWTPIWKWVMLARDRKNRQACCGEVRFTSADVGASRWVKWGSRHCIPPIGGAQVPPRALEFVWTLQSVLTGLYKISLRGGRENA